MGGKEIRDDITMPNMQAWRGNMQVKERRCWMLYADCSHEYLPTTNNMCSADCSQ